MRALKLLTEFVKWRWTPCVALVASSFLYVLVAVLFVPNDLSLQGAAPKSVNVIGGMDQPNAMTPARTEAPSRLPNRPAAPVFQPPPPTPVAPQPVAPAPAPPPAPVPPPVREDPPAPAPEPTPTPEQVEQGAGDVPQGAASRFTSSRMRILPAAAAAAAAAGAAPPQATDEPPSDEEE